MPDTQCPCKKRDCPNHGNCEACVPIIPVPGGRGPATESAKEGGKLHPKRNEAKDSPAVYLLFGRCTAGLFFLL